MSPQVILGGTVLPVEQLDWHLEHPARVVPVTYPTEGMAYVVPGRGEAVDRWTAIVVLAVFTVVTIGAVGLVVDRQGDARRIS